MCLLLHIMSIFRLHKQWPRLYSLVTSPVCTGTTRKPSISLQWKPDESTKHYLTQMLPAINWLYWQAGKFTLAYEGSKWLHVNTLHWIPPGFRKNKRFDTFLTEGYGIFLPLILRGIWTTTDFLLFFFQCKKIIITEEINILDTRPAYTDFLSPSRTSSPYAMYTFLADIFVAKIRF